MDGRKAGPRERVRFVPIPAAGDRRRQSAENPWSVTGVVPAGPKKTRSNYASNVPPATSLYTCR